MEIELWGIGGVGVKDTRGNMEIELWGIGMGVRDTNPNSIFCCSTPTSIEDYIEICVSSSSDV